jgi:hypothetical protein
LNKPNPALVTQRGARRLPRSALLILCAAYLLPGLFGREVWRGAEFTAFGQMVAMADGRTSWWSPVLGGVPGDTALLSHWLGAAAITLGRGWLEPSLASRLPFLALMALTLVCVWATTFHLARTEAAQPVAFAFGGEADPVDYARAIADGAVLALIACLGLLLPGHESTPELAQLMATAWWLYGLAAAPYRTWPARLSVLFALPLLAAAGAPSMAMGLGAVALVVCGLSRLPQARALVPWVAASSATAALVAMGLGAWRVRTASWGLAELPGIARQWLWFMWPLWPMVLWTLWRWRRQRSYRHISVPLGVVLVALAANLAMAGSDRALLLGLPGMAVLAAFALPTLKRSASAAVDWFSMLFFTGVALWFWLVYVAIQTGWPAWQARNALKLVPGFERQFSATVLVVAVVATVAWFALVRWRTGRQREALWKSLVLPACGVTLCWLLFMTLLLAPLDYARSARPWVRAVASKVPTQACIWAPALTPSTVAALEHLGGWRVDARTVPELRCDFQLLIRRRAQPPSTPPGWTPVAEIPRPTDKDELTTVYRRLGLP